MSYIPPACNAVDFTIDRYIIIQPCNAVDFNLVDDISIGLISKASNVYLRGDKWYFAEGYLITLAKSVITPRSGIFNFHAISEIAPSLSSIVVSTPINLLRILPDCISKDSIIDIKNAIYLFKKPEPQDLPIAAKSSGYISYSTPIRSDEHMVLPWGDGVKTDIFTEINPEDFTDISSEVIDGWKSFLESDISTDLVSSDISTHIDNATDSLWKSFLPADLLSNIQYGNKYELNGTFTIPYRQPGPKDKTVFASFDFLDRQYIHFYFNWNAPEANDRHQEVNWGPINYFEFCNKQYWPPNDGIVNFKLNQVLEADMVNVCYNVTFDIDGYNTDIRCPYQSTKTGARDPYTGGGFNDIPHIYPIPRKEMYYMLNTVLVKRLPDNIPIEVTSVDIQYDMQSWLWQFTLTIRDEKYLNLLKPSGSTLIDVEVYINGWKFTCTIESWREGASFGNSSWTVTGRSPSMMLGSPQNQKSSHIYGVGDSIASSGGQIIDDVLDGVDLGLNNTGWNMDWTYYTDVHTGFDPFVADNYAGWGFPPETFSWSDKTQIEVVKGLTDSIGAFIITKPDCYLAADRKLYIRPQFDIPPWYWNDPDGTNFPEFQHTIDVAYTSEIGRDYAKLPVYTAVYVMGQKETTPQTFESTDGIVVTELYRDGVGPAYRVYAPDIVDPNLTSWQACKERGRMVLCDTGEWVKHTLRLFSIAQKDDPNATLCGLMLPGDFVRVMDKNTTWYGMITSVGLRAAVVSGSAFAVTQTVEVNRYTGS